MWEERKRERGREVKGMRVWGRVASYKNPLFPPLLSYRKLPLCFCVFFNGVWKKKNRTEKGKTTNWSGKCVFQK